MTIWPPLVWATVTGDPSTCPSHEAVVRAVRALLSRAHVEEGNLLADTELRDNGSRFQVSVRGRTREYEDEQRDCLRRARVAAVFVALTVAPPTIEDPAPEDEMHPPTAAKDAVAPEPPALVPPASASVKPLQVTPATESSTQPADTTDSTSWRLGIELGPSIFVAPRPSDSPASLGATGRFVLIRRTLGCSLGASASTTSELALGSSRIRQTRTPFDISLRWRWTGPSVGAALDVGVVLASMHLRPANGATTVSKTLVEWGTRAAITLRWGNGPLAPYLSGSAEWIPFPAALAVQPRGTIGQAAPLWLGATVGLSYVFR